MGVEPIRVCARDAAIMLGIKARALRVRIAKGDLVPLTPPRERGPGQRTWLHRGEVEAFIVGGRLGAAAFRQRNKKFWPKGNP